MGWNTKYRGSPLGNGVLRWDGKTLTRTSTNSDCPLNRWEYSYSYTLVSRLSSRFVHILIIDYKGVGSEAGWVIGNTTKISGLSSMSCNEYMICAPNDCLSPPQLFSRSVSLIHSESSLPSMFALQHQGATSTPPLPSPSAFSKSSLC